ncbi:hypothetical protein OZX56_04315 [Lactobacillus sp. ESL0684]|uniref:hypothetical protein n=1 Tax=Lactobacillus sp. ESL0684 TaxID=2983213 RepID=UPI0023F78E14|nr:hypothetical protein [Lactobacillus sp. ESL0684]WEV44460.1 hypothetical protein OZX56_04315 [Lactobacillus sp. ESL0684]
MKFKKTGLIIIIFLSFLGIGSMLSNIQSREADQLLEAYGLSNNTRTIKINNSQRVSDLIDYLQKKHPRSAIQVHLVEQDKQSNQTLVWANHNVVSLPTESGRYFTLDNFKGQVSFAVLGLNCPIATLKTQGNQYVILHKQYYSVIGTLKHYRQMKQDGYYLTTGSNQPTGQFKLKNYQIMIDSSPKVIKQIANHYQVKAKTPVFVRKHQIHQFSILKELVAIMLFSLAAACCNLLLALLDWQLVKKTSLSGKLLRNWLLNRGIRNMLLELLVTLAANLFLNWRAFYSRPLALVWLLMISWVFIIAIYAVSLVYLLRKDQHRAGITK